MNCDVVLEPRSQEGNQFLTFRYTTGFRCLNKLSYTLLGCLVLLAMPIVTGVPSLTHKPFLVAEVLGSMRVNQPEGSLDLRPLTAREGLG